MSLQDEVPLDIPEDTAHVGEAILKPDNFYRQLGERFVELAPPASAFEPLYEVTGRGAIPPVLLTLVIVFQMLEKAPDRLAAEWVVSRLDWKYALHLPLTYAGFHFTDLYAFRQRLLAHRQEALVLDHLLQRLQQVGVLPRTSRVRTDSTHVLGVVERLSRLEALSEGVRLALVAVTALASEWVEQSVPATLRESYARRFSEYGLSQSQVRARWAQVTHDGWWFLARLDTDGPLWTRHLPEVETLRTLLAQQPPSTPPSAPAAPPPAGEPSAEGERPAEPAVPTGELPAEGEPPAEPAAPTGELPAEGERPAEPASVAGEPAAPTGMVVTSAERLVSPHEPEVRYGEKRGQGWLGYKLQLTETCEPDQPHLIVDLSPTAAPAGDSPQLPLIQARLAQHELCPAQHLVDQGYMSASHLVSSAQQDIWLLGPLPPDTRNAGGYQQADFVVDEAQQQVRCPQDHLSVVWRRAQRQRQTEPARPPPLQVRFAAATCQACPAFGVCTSSPKGRSLELHPLWAVMQRQRALMASPLYQRLLQVRAGVEGTIAEVTGALGLRRARYRGRAKLGLQCYFTAVALNLKRLIRWWTDPRRAGQAGRPSLTARPAVA